MLWRVLPSMYPTVYYTQMVWSVVALFKWDKLQGRGVAHVCRYSLRMIYVNCTASTLTYSDWYSSGTPVNDERVSRQIMIIARINNTWKILQANVKPNVTSKYWGWRKYCYWSFSSLAPTSTPMCVVLSFARYRHFDLFLLYQKGCRKYESNSRKRVWNLEILRPLHIQGFFLCPQYGKNWLKRTSWSRARLGKLIVAKLVEKFSSLCEYKLYGLIIVRWTQVKDADKINITIRTIFLSLFLSMILSSYPL